MRPLLLILLLPLLFLDALGNLLFCDGSFRNTMSSEAWAHREKNDWHKVVDCIFGDNHCQEQYEREQKFGSVWAAWRNDFKGATWLA